MKTFYTFVILAVSVLANEPSIAQGLHAIRELPGYVCMDLNLTERQMMDTSIEIPVLDQPSSAGARVGIASATNIVVSPPRPVNGYLHMLRFNGDFAWIDARYLKPWKNPGISGQQCVPSLMSNGRPGLGVK